MALIVTPGSADAESYADEDYARAHFVKTPRNAKWLALGAMAQTAWLREAILCIDAQDYLGSRSNPIEGEEQALEFPRKATHLSGSNNFTGGSSWEDRRGREYEDDEIPEDVKKAHCEMALALAENDQYLNNRHKARRINAGNAEIDIAVGKDLGTLCPLAYFLLKPFLARTKGSGRVERN